MEKQKFEESVKEVFVRAEVEPSPSVWTNIELDLERLEGKSLRRRVLFYKFAAAASLIFALSVGMYYFNGTPDSDQTTSESLAASEQSLPSVSDPSTNSSISPLAEAPEEGVGSETSSYGQSIRKKKTDQALPDSEHPGNRHATSVPMGSASGNNVPTDVADGMPVHEDRTLTLFSLSELSLPAIYQRGAAPKLDFTGTSYDAGQRLLAKRAYEEEMLNKKKSEKEKSATEGLWTSLGVGAGTFSSITSLSEAAPASSFNSYYLSNAVESETSAGGSSYSVGLQLGGSLSKRWVVQGGFNYLSQQSQYTSNAAVYDDQRGYYSATSVAELNMNQDVVGNAILGTSDYHVNSQRTYISVPVIAGYRILDRSFGIMLNTGISTDLFLQQVLTTDNEAIASSSTGRESDSPYRPVNFSGLLGTEFSYRLADRYRVALNPGIRYPFSSIYKSETGIENMPFSFDVALRFNYIFR
jgi:hypothetical protein